MSEVEEERVTSKKETSEGNWFANSVVEEEPPPPGEGEVEGDSGPVAELEGKTADGERKDVKEEKCAVEGEKRGAEGEEERKLFVLGLMESDHLALRAVCEAHGAVQEVKVLPLTGGKDLTYGFVTFEQREEAAAALEHLRAHGLGGRRLTDVQFSKKGSDRKRPRTGESSSTGTGPAAGRCHTCGEGGHYSRECYRVHRERRTHQQQVHQDFRHQFQQSLHRYYQQNPHNLQRNNQSLIQGQMNQQNIQPQTAPQQYQQQVEQYYQQLQQQQGVVWPWAPPVVSSSPWAPAHQWLGAVEHYGSYGGDWQGHYYSPYHQGQLTPTEPTGVKEEAGAEPGVKEESQVKERSDGEFGGKEGNDDEESSEESQPTLEQCPSCQPTLEQCPTSPATLLSPRRSLPAEHLLPGTTEQE